MLSAGSAAAGVAGLTRLPRPQIGQGRGFLLGNRRCRGFHQSIALSWQRCVFCAIFRFFVGKNKAPAFAGAARACYVVFDLLQLNGKNIRRQRIEDRRAEIERVVEGRSDAILFSEAIAVEGALVFDHDRDLPARGQTLN